MGTYLQTACLGYPVFNNHLTRLKIEERNLVNTINQYSYYMAEKASAFKKALMCSDDLLPNGVGFVITSKFLSGNKITKIAGADIHQILLEKLDREKGSCFYLGASQATLDKFETLLSMDFLNIRVGTYSQPFKPAFTAVESQTMVVAVNAFTPDLLFVGMTAPKKEKWAYTHKDQLQTGLNIPLGPSLIYILVLQ